MNITATTLSRLDAGSNYYLSNTTGTIKKANLWQWIKCFTGFGDGRAKAQRLAEAVQAAQGSRLGFPITKDNGENRRKLNIPRFKFDDLHFRAVLAALITKDGPANLIDFTRRMAFFQEEILQERRDALLSTRLEPPETPLSGFVFADTASKLYKAMEDSEWHRQSMQ